MNVQQENCAVSHIIYIQSNPITGLDRPTVPGGLGSQISRQSTHEGGKVFSPVHQLPLPPGNIPGTHFC